jgi:hypothetical protein
MSSSKDTSILVRLAPPVLWGDAPAATGDTAWVTINSGAGKPYPVHINHFDTNGTIVNYYWNEADSTLGRTTSTDTILRNFSILEMNHGLPMWIYGRDNDGLLRGRKFVVFADSAPQEPSLGSATISRDSVQFVWQNADVKDGDSTQFQILFDTNNPPSTIVKPFGTCKKQGGLFYYWHHPAASGIYRFKVIARDARGTISSSQVSSFFVFLKP